MPWIKVVEPQDAQGKLNDLYTRIGARTGGAVANILKVHSLHPEALEAHLNLYETIMFGQSGLSRGQREMIAVAVSSTNSCKYWTVHHGESLRLETKDNDLSVKVAADFTSAGISEQDKQMLRYAAILTKKPHAVEASDIEALRKAGFSDRDILDINQVTAYYNYVNRIADGLGVTLE
jgi:uncharacterized peroxidase-related enzyme